MQSPSWVGETLDGAGGWSRRAMAPWLLGLLMLFDSWDSVVISYILPSIRQEWALDILTGSWLPFAGFGGQFFGAILFGSLAERRGRLPIVKLLALVMGLLAIACAFTGSYEQLLVIRAVQGLAIGGALPVAISYINEIAPTATRGRFFGTFQFLMISGFALCSVVSYFIVPHLDKQLGWRLMFGLGAAPLLVLPFTLLLPESPRWLAGRARVDEAADSLARLGAATLPPAQARTAVAGGGEKIPFAMLFAPEIARTTVVVMLMWFLTSLVSYGLQTWIPSLYTSMFGIPLAQALKYSLIAAIGVFFLPLILRFSIDRIGRRPLPMLGTALGGIALVSLLFVDRNATLAIVSLALIGQIGVSIGSMVLWPYSAEIYPTRIRSLALGTASSVARAASTATQFLVGGVLQWTNSATPVFVTFGLAAFAVALLWLFGTRETAGRKMLD